MNLVLGKEAHIPNSDRQVPLGAAQTHQDRLMLGGVDQVPHFVRIGLQVVEFLGRFRFPEERPRRVQLALIV